MRGWFCPYVHLPTTINLTKCKRPPLVILLFFVLLFFPRRYLDFEKSWNSKKCIFFQWHFCNLCEWGFGQLLWFLFSGSLAKIFPVSYLWYQVKQFVRVIFKQGWSEQNHACKKTLNMAKRAPPKNTFFPKKQKLVFSQNRVYPSLIFKSENTFKNTWKLGGGDVWVPRK